MSTEQRAAAGIFGNYRVEVFTDEGGNYLEVTVSDDSLNKKSSWKFKSLTDKENYEKLKATANWLFSTLGTINPNERLTQIRHDYTIRSKNTNGQNIEVGTGRRLDDVSTPKDVALVASKKEEQKYVEPLVYPKSSARA